METAAVKTEEPPAKRARAAESNEDAAPAEEQHRPANYVLRYTCEGHDNSLSSLKFSPDGKWLASACEQKPFPLFLLRHRAHADCTDYVCSRLGTAAADKTIRIWNALDGKFESILKGHTQASSH